MYGFYLLNDSSMYQLYNLKSLFRRGSIIGKQTQLSNISESSIYFVKTLTRYKTDMKHAVTMPSHQRHRVTCVSSNIIF